MSSSVLLGVESGTDPLPRTGQPPRAHHCSASFGGALLCDGAADAASSLSDADPAMYESNKLGRNRVSLSAAV